MSPYIRQNKAEFEGSTRATFGFLSTDYDFHVDTAPFKYLNPYSTFFRKARTFVYIEGVSYGFSLNVQIGRLTFLRKVQSQFNLDSLMRLRHPELLEPRFPAERGPLVDLKFAADALKQCAPDFLAGDFTALPQALAAEAGYRAESMRSSEDDTLKRTCLQASEAFHAGDFAGAAALLGPHEVRLTKAQAALLTLARKCLR